MNNLEKRMVDILIDLKDNNGVIGVKAEFEAEGTRLEEALRLKEVISKAGLDLVIKIGGCEAIKDMYEARVIGVSGIVAPMIETPYALKKFLDATSIVFPKEEQDEVSFFVNLETIDGYEKFDKMLEIPQIGRLDGIVLGRVDMTGSLGISREEINSPRILEIAKDSFKKAKAKGLECTVGGGVSAASLDFFRQLPELSRYETRKVIFKAPESLHKNPEQGILKAVGFELMWLKNKREFYGMIHSEDNIRIEMLESRYNKMIVEAGGMYK